jgi:hypothetical protein
MTEESFAYGTWQDPLATGSHPIFQSSILNPDPFSLILPLHVCPSPPPNFSIRVLPDFRPIAPAALPYSKAWQGWLSPWPPPHLFHNEPLSKSIFSPYLCGI